MHFNHQPQPVLLKYPLQGSVEQPIHGRQLGRVLAMNRTWDAQLAVPDLNCSLLPNTPVVVVGAIQNTLLVLPMLP